MVVTYRCRCGHEFNGHWHEAEKRRKQQPTATRWMVSPAQIATVCPKCGNVDLKHNIDNDEEGGPDPCGP